MSSAVSTPTSIAWRPCETSSSSSDTCSSEPGDSGPRRRRATMSGQREVASFAYKFGGMYSAGLSIANCLETLERQTDNRAFRMILADVRRRVEAGASLRAAFEPHRKIFSDFFLGMIDAGESSGRLAPVAGGECPLSGETPGASAEGPGRVRVSHRGRPGLLHRGDLSADLCGSGVLATVPEDARATAGADPGAGPVQPGAAVLVVGAAARRWRASCWACGVCSPIRRCGLAGIG